MGVITKSTFDAFNAFVNVRLQQGVPLVDADVNELDDIRKFEMRAFLKWFVGNGVPEGNDGFRIAPLATPAADDFQILAGAQLTGALPAAPGQERDNYRVKSLGRCIVDGLDVIIASDTTYTEQPHFTAASVQPLPIPSATDVILSYLVYIDVWERLVLPSEVPSLIVPPLGIESCARTKREWAVRTRMALDLPVPGAPGFPADHSYYALALIGQRVVNGVAQPILQNDILDLREQRLLMPPSTLITDVLGRTAAEYRRGMNRPALSLRESLNALLRNEVPATVERSLPHASSAASRHEVSYAVTFDRVGGVNVIWTSVPSSSNVELLAARWDPAKPEAGFVLPAKPRIASETPLSYYPHAATLPTGDLMVVYTALTAAGAQPGVFFKRATDVNSLPSASPQLIKDPNTGPAWRPHVVVVPTASGGYVVFFWQAADPDPSKVGWAWMFRRRRYGGDWSEDNARWDAPPAALPHAVGDKGADLLDSKPEGNIAGFHATVDLDRNVWVTYRSASFGIIQVARLDESGNPTALPFPDGQGALFHPFVLIDDSGCMWMFCYKQGANWPIGIYVQRYNQHGDPIDKNSEGHPVPVLIPATTDNLWGVDPLVQPWGGAVTATLDSQGGVWVFWRGKLSIMSARWSPRTSEWGEARPISGLTSPSSPGTDATLVGARSAGGALWLFWQDAQTGTQNILYQQATPEL